MSSRQNYFQSQFQFSTNPIMDHRFELQESDIFYNSNHHPTLLSPPSTPRARNRPASRKPSVSGGRSSSSSSLPVKIPDWSKILGASSEEWEGRYNGDINNEDNEVGGSEEEDDGEERVPPHEYAARRVARRGGTVVAFSVQEGVGRTLKGRDLRRVRNAIWKQTGFED